jgi:hypothetical protein
MGGATRLYDRPMRKGASIVAALACLLVAAPGAAAYVYWSSSDSAYSRVGRADLDGGNVKPALVSGIYYGGGVASDGTYVYWGSSGSSPYQAQIGRATIGGGSPDGAFQSASTVCGVFDVKATATDLLWLKSDCSASPDRSIAQVAKTGGQGGVGEPAAANGICGLAVDATYVYWSESHFIGRAPLAGGAANHTWLDTGASTSPCAVAVDSGHVYWTNTQPQVDFRGTTIGRATIDGNPASVQNDFIAGATFATPSGLAVSGGFVYWANQPAQVSSPAASAARTSTGPGSSRTSSRTCSTRRASPSTPRDRRREPAVAAPPAAAVAVAPAGPAAASAAADRSRGCASARSPAPIARSPPARARRRCGARPWRGSARTAASRAAPSSRSGSTAPPASRSRSGA